jgi:hypothetical protein
MQKKYVYTKHYSSSHKIIHAVLAHTKVYKCELLEITDYLFWIMHSNKSQLLYVIVIYAVGKCVQWEKERRKPQGVRGIY